jgi:hypothetical protein
MTPQSRSHVQEAAGARMVQTAKHARVEPNSGITDPCLLLDLPTELVSCVCLSKTMQDSPEGGVSLSLLARTCTVFGKPSQKGDLSLVAKDAQEMCKQRGVRRLPLKKSDDWCWPRLLSWMSQAVYVGATHHSKTIRQGVDTAQFAEDALVQARDHFSATTQGPGSLTIYFLVRSNDLQRHQSETVTRSHSAL